MDPLRDPHSVAIDRLDFPLFETDLVSETVPSTLEGNRPNCGFAEPRLE